MPSLDGGYVKLDTLKGYVLWLRLILCMAIIALIWNGIYGGGIKGLREWIELERLNRPVAISKRIDIDNINNYVPHSGHTMHIMERLIRKQANWSTMHWGNYPHCIDCPRYSRRQDGAGPLGVAQDRYCSLIGGGAGNGPSAGNSNKNESGAIVR